jgi:hypothetical protein
MVEVKINVGEQQHAFDLLGPKLSFPNVSELYFSNRVPLGERRCCLSALMLGEDLQADGH